jgi:PhnB protein
MTSKVLHIRQGHGAVRPYLHGPVGLPEFLRQVFGAVELERFEFGPESVHVEMQIGDSTVVVEAGELPPDVRPWVGSVYVYVPDVDAVYLRALELGATSLSAVEDKPYDERQGGFIDAGGNTWWVATYLAKGQ